MAALAATTTATAVTPPPPPKCVQIFYDKAPQATTPYYYGRTHAIFAQNLLGHFPHVQQIVSPIEKYKKGQLDKCQANIYLATYYGNAIPQDFIDDYLVAKKNVLWAGYGIWTLGADKLKTLWDVEYRGLSKLDREHPDKKKRPGYFRYFDYKGEVFRKYGEYDKDSGLFMAAWEIVLFQYLSAEAAQKYTKSWAIHSTVSSRSPYVLQNGHQWYMADVPFTFMTEEDRYLIFTDLLFDLLDEKPVYAHGKRPALVRFEDVHSRMPKDHRYQMVQTFEHAKIPFTISMIPLFKDPYGVLEKDPAFQTEKFTDNPEFLEFLKYAAKAKGSITWHGVTHQYEEMKNPFAGTSGVDFEFWDRTVDKPVQKDSPQWVVERMEEGFTLMQKAGIRPAAWLTPHYQASPLDYVIFSQLFFWNVGRVTYFPFKKTQPAPLPSLLTLDMSGTDYNGKRLPYFQNLKVTYPTELRPSGQMFPYEIHGDVYGQRLIPEAIGNVQPYLSEQVLKTVTVDDMIRHMKRNRVIRDAWASYFVHAVLLNLVDDGGLAEFPGDTRELDRLLQSTKDLGYEFVDLPVWTRANLKKKRLEPIEIE